MEDIFQVQRRCLLLMGHNMNEDKKKGKSHSMIYVTTLLLVLSAQIPMMNYTIYHSDNISMVTASLSICVTNLLTVTKITAFLMYKPKYIEIMQQLMDMYHSEKEPAAQSILMIYNKIATKFARIYTYSVCVTVFYFLTAPLIKMLYTCMRGYNIVYELPMPMRLPFDYEASTPGYEFTYFYTVIVAIIVGIYASAIDGIFVALAMNLGAHFKVLQYFVESMHITGSAEQEHLQIRSMIQYHQQLLEVAEKIRELYTPIIFAEFLMTSLQVCVIVYQLLTHLDTILVLIVNCAFLASILLQLFFYCYGGEIIKEESLKIAEAVQLSNWYNLKSHQRHMYRLLMLRSQHATVIKAGFYDATLANFMTILKAAMSYITLIQSIENSTKNNI